MNKKIFDCVVINKQGKRIEHSLSHLKDLSITIENLQLENGDNTNIQIYVYPTNHVYSRKIIDSDNIDALRDTNELLIRYKHEECNTTKLILNNGKPAFFEHRVFNYIKYQQSHLLPTFLEFLEKHCKQKCILANGGDDKKSLSALFSLPHPYDDAQAYLVIFKLKKVNGHSVNMLIETAFVESIQKDHRLQKIDNPKNRTQKNKLKPFTVLLKNVLAGRKPFEGRPQGKRKNRRNRNKQR